MNAIDLIYNEVYKGCLKAGCDEATSRNQAVFCVQKYKNNQFTTPSKLVQQCITEGKKLKIKSVKR